MGIKYAQESSENDRLIKQSINQNKFRVSTAGSGAFRKTFNIEKTYAYDSYPTANTTNGNNNTTASTNKRPSTRAAKGTNQQEMLSNDDYKSGFNPMMIMSINNNSEKAKENPMMNQRPNIRISKTAIGGARKKVIQVKEAMEQQPPQKKKESIKKVKSPTGEKKIEIFEKDIDASEIGVKEIDHSGHNESHDLEFLLDEI